MLQHAFKEWAVICKALASGQQIVILRKGGIAEAQGDFALEHRRFWLFPTYLHQQRAGLRTDAQPLLDQVLAQRAPENVVRLSHFAEVTRVFEINDLVPAFLIGDFHLWSYATVEKRFNYKTPGLNLLAVRIFRLPEAHDIPNLARYEGCKSWVELEEPLSTEGAVPVVGEAGYRDLSGQLEVVMKATALA